MHRLQTELGAYNKTYQALKEAGGVFIDPEFPPKEESIIDPLDDVDDLQDLGPVTWKRIEDIPGLVDQAGELSIFHSKIEPNDIQ